MTRPTGLTRPSQLRDRAQNGRRKAWAAGSSSQLLASVFAVCCAAAVGAQVTAHQGNAPIEAAKRFASPMVLTIPLPELSAAKDVRGLSVPGIRGYRCEDASIASMTLSVSTARKGARTYEFSGLLLVDESFDRFVSLHLELRDSADKVLVSGRQNSISVEEEKSSRFSIRSEVSADQAAIIDGAGALSLQVTMYVRKD